MLSTIGFQLSIRARPFSTRHEDQSLPAYTPVVVVDKVSKARRVHHCEAKSHSVLDNVCPSNTRRGFQHSEATFISHAHSPALMLSIATVFGRSKLGGGTSFLG